MGDHMKNAQLAMGLLIGTALGASIMVFGKVAPAGDSESVKKIVRETIMSEPKLLIDSVQKYQEDLRAQALQGATDALKDPAVRAAAYDTHNAGSYGPADSKRIVVQFFDYNCPACKAQHKALGALLAHDKDVRVLFREYPIFGPVSDRNSHLGLAVARLYPEKYYAFYEKMMEHQGHAEEKDTLGYIKELGMDIEKVKAEAGKREIDAALEANRALGEQLHIQGTPTLVIGNEVIPHALAPEEIEQKLSAPADKADAAAKAAPAKADPAAESNTDDK